jgi:uncharacterized protein
VKKDPAFQSTEFSDTDELVLPEGFRYEIIRRSGGPLTVNQLYGGDHSDYVAYVSVDALKLSEDSEGWHPPGRPRAHVPFVLV